MFVRTKLNRGGSMSIRVIDKSGDKSKLVKTIGKSTDEKQIALLKQQAGQWIKQHQGLQELDFHNERGETLRYLDNISSIRPAGATLILEKIFEEIVFHKMNDVFFRRLVIARICFPASKLKTTDYLSRYEYFDVDVHVVYRYLDKAVQHAKAKGSTDKL